MTDDAWLKSVASVSDACVELQGFACKRHSRPLFNSRMRLCLPTSQNAADPGLVHSFPHSHGLVHVRSFPTLQTVLAPSYKHSTLLGLGAGSTGQNNLSFRLKRKRFVVETLHLGVEGGVGERRTEPPATMKSLTAGGGGTGGHVHGSGCSHGGGDIEGVVGGVDKVSPDAMAAKPDEALEKPRARFAAMDISLETEGAVSSTRSPNDEASPKPKKERRKVAFMQHDKPELYDF